MDEEDFEKSLDDIASGEVSDSDTEIVDPSGLGVPETDVADFLENDVVCTCVDDGLVPLTDVISGLTLDRDVVLGS